MHLNNTCYFFCLGSKCTLDLINVEDAFEPRHEKWGITTLEERVHVISHLRIAEQTNGNTLEGFYKQLHSGGKDEPALCRPEPVPEAVADVKMDGDRLVMSVDDWTTRWEQGKTGFHNENCHG